MALAVSHAFVSTIPDDPASTAAGEVTPTRWNAGHSLTGTADVAQGGTGAATLTGYVKGNGTAAMTASATVPTSDLSGSISVANGGTGAASFTATRLLIGNGTSPITTDAGLTFNGAALQAPRVNLLAADTATYTGIWYDSTNNNAYALGGGRDAATGDDNVCVGRYAGKAITTGSGNTFIGVAGSAVTTGSDNVAFGLAALAAGNNPVGNMALGSYALYNSNSFGNTGIGGTALFDVSSGQKNTGIGVSALQHALGDLNIGIGFSAGTVLVGGYAYGRNTLLGSLSNTNNADSENRTAVGYFCIADQDNQVFIGNSDVTNWNSAGSGVTYLGRADREFKGIYLANGTDTTAGVAATINCATGRFRISAGSTAFTLTNSEIAAGDIVICQPCQNDLTGTVKNTIPAGGSCVINFVAPTANMDVMFQVIKN